MNLGKYKLNGFRLVMNIWKSGAILAMVVSMCAIALSQTSAFTYQGKLNDGGIPSNSTYDMQFRLFDALNAGTQIGVTQTVTSVQTAAGIFTVQLDLGSGAFTGADRFVEISISRAGQNNFTPLAPRQSLTSAPYSVQATNAATAANALQLGGLPASQFVETSDSRMSDARMPLPGSGNYIQNLTTPQAGVNFNIGGTGSANVLNAVTQFNLNGIRILSNPGTDNLFAGVGAGAVNTGSSNTFVGKNAGAANTNAGGNAFFGALAGQVSRGINNSFFGAGAGASNANGNHNAFFGIVAGNKNETGVNNSFVGASAGRESTTGIMNSFFGFGSGINNTTGSENVFIGALAGNQSAATQVSNSIAIGTGVTVSTSNTIVLGKTSHTTRIPGKIVMDVAETFRSGGPIEGLFTPNIVLSGINNILPSIVHTCMRPTPAAGFGGEGLTRCTSAFSSINNKVDVQPFSGGLDIIKRLNPVAFTWKNGGGNDVGLNAEDVDAVAPQFVKRNDKGEIEEVTENSLDVLFINAIKQQQTQLEEQEKRIQTQQEQILQQRQQIDALRKLFCQTNGQAEVCREN